MKGIMNLVKGLTDGHSLFETPAHSRIMKITIVKRMPLAKLEKKNSISKEASIDRLAKEYAMYKLAALRYLEDQNKLDEDLLINALIQNR